MEKEIIEELRQQLEEKRADLTARITELRKPVDMGDDIDSFDEETDEAEEYSANMGMVEELKRSLERVSDALAKIKSGKYGICENCSQAIDKELLMADPETRLCRDCKLKERD